MRRREVEGAEKENILNKNPPMSTSVGAIQGPIEVTRTTYASTREDSTAKKPPINSTLQFMIALTFIIIFRI
jgi:hypothetical protein